MLKHPDYQITDQLYEGKKTTIYRGKQKNDGSPVIIKVLNKINNNSFAIKHFRYQYEIVKNNLNNLSRIIKHYTFLENNAFYAIVMEDIHGDSIEKFIHSKKIDLMMFFKIALKMIEAIDQVHSKRIIHKDVKPHNFILNYQTGEVKLIDFGLSTKLNREIQEIVNPEILEGTLAYISPEQTGRMNRSVDYRSDLYSLGITFYEMLTTKLPFESNDPMKIIHSHIARTAIFPHQIDKRIPDMISNIIMKLLSKNAEDRYQSTYGLKHDLEKSYLEFKEKKAIQKFKIAQQDISEKFQIPEKLYGRQQEIADLMDIFYSVAAGNKRILFIKGISGIGKTSLINEINKPILEKNGYFIKGKYDKLKRSTPFTGIIQAFNELINQLLTQDTEQLEYWKTTILNCVGNIGQVIVDVIKHLELIIGKQAKVPKLPVKESLNRFNLLFQKFVKLFATEKHPLVLFLDDLQNADKTSLQLIKTMFTNPELNHFLIIGSYRDNEIDTAHPLMKMQKKIQQEGIKWDELTLKPLKRDHVNNLISETLYCKQDKTKELANLIYSKTHGNPFFISEFIKKLYVDNFINFKKGWQWDLSKIKQASIANNVVELMTNKIKQLPQNVFNLLKIASCIGTKMYWNILITIYKKTKDQIIIELLQIINQGMLIIRENSINFVHDRVHEAVYSLISDKEKKELHYKIGNAILNIAKKEKNIDDKLFNIVNQLNFAKNLLNKKEKKELAQLNLNAGIKAKASTAYDAALEFSTNGIELLDKDSWTTNYELTFKLYKEKGEAEHLNTNFKNAEKYFDIVLKESKSMIDKINVYITIIPLYTNQNKMTEAVFTGLRALKILGIKISKNPSKLSLLPEIAKAKIKLKGKDIEKLINLPNMKDEKQLLAMKLLMYIFAPSFQALPNLFPFIVIKMLNLTLKYGNSSYSAFSFVVYGLFSVVAFRDMNSAYEFGKLAFKIMDKYNATELKSKINFLFGVAINHFKHHMKENLKYFEIGLDAGFESGDLEYSSYCLINYFSQMFFLGENLEKINNLISTYDKTIIRMKNVDAIDVVYIIHDMILKMMENPKTNYLRNIYNYDKEKKNIEYINSKNAKAIDNLHLPSLVVSYIFKKHENALKTALLLKKHLIGLEGTSLLPEYYFYYSLTMLALHDNAIPKIQKDYQKTIKQNQKELKKFSDDCPYNYLHKYLLVAAETARIYHDDNNAIRLYDEAIASAKENNFTQNEAIANELAAEYYIAKNKQNIAREYIINARYCYIKWGSKPKIKQIEKTHASLFKSFHEAQETYKSTISETISFPSSTQTASSDSIVRFLDFASIMKLSQAISSEIVMENLLSKMIKIVIESAGAQNGFIIFTDKDNNLLIEAEGKIDKKEISVLKSIPIKMCNDLCPAIIQYSIKTNKQVLLDNAMKEGLFTADPYIIKNNIKSVLCQPILKQNKLIGLLYLENNISTQAFTSKKQEILNVLSSQIAISIENAKLIENLKEQERLKQEMKIAEKIQTSIVPRPFAHENLEITALMKPAEEVGGDYYDLILDHQNHLWLALGDVTGHGVTPGLIMMMAETCLLSNLMERSISPKEALTALNKVLFENVRNRLEQRHFMTMCILKYLGKGKFIYSNAGHPGVVIYRNKTKTCEHVYLDSPFLNILKDVAEVLLEKEIILKTDDIMLLYSDGVTESHKKNDFKLLFGIKKLEQILIKNANKTVTEIQNIILQDSLAWCNKNQDDDITILVVKKK